MPTNNVSHKNTTEALNIPHQFALLYWDILSYLNGIASGEYSDTEENYVNKLCQNLDTLAQFIRNRTGLQEILAFFRAFGTTRDGITDNQIIDIIRKIQGLDSDIEIIRTLFGLFGRLGNDNGTKMDINLLTNPILRHYEGYKNDGHIGKLSLEKINEYQFGYISGDEKLFGELIIDNPPTRHALTLVKNALRVVETIISEGGEPSTSLSKAQEGFRNRRDRDRDLAGKRDRLRAQEGYIQDLEILRADAEFINQQFERLKLYILENISYVLSVLEYLEIVEEVQKFGIGDQSISKDGILNDQHVYGFERIRKIIEEDEGKLGQLIKERDGLRIGQDRGEVYGFKHGELQASPKVKNSRKSINALDRKISRLERRITKLKSQQNEWEGLLKLRKLTQNPISMIPGLEDFRRDFYSALRAREIYMTSQNPDNTPVSSVWIEENILQIFIELLGKHLRIGDTSILDLRGFIDSVEELPNEYTESADIKVEGLIQFPSQAQCRSFFDTLISLIPLHERVDTKK